MVQVVEDTSFCLEVGELVRAGLFQLGGPQRIRIRRAHVAMNVGLSKDRQRLQVRFAGADGARRVQAIALQTRTLAWGERCYFTCPITGEAALKLYLLNDRLGSRKAHGLGYLSQNDRRRHRAARDAARELPVQAINRPASRMDVQAGLLGGRAQPERASERIIEELTYCHDRCGSFCQWPPPESPGHAERRPRLEVAEVRALGLLKPGQRTGVQLAWPYAVGAFDYALAVFDWRDEPSLLFSVHRGDEISSMERIELVMRGRRLFWLCPLSGFRTTKLWLRQERLGSRKAQLIERDPRPEAAASWTGVSRRRSATAPHHRF